MLNRLLPWLFITLAAPVCLFLAFTVPLGQVPDESAHAVRADSLTHFDLVGRRQVLVDAKGGTVRQAGVTADVSLMAVTAPLMPVSFGEAQVLTPLSRERREALQHTLWAGRPEFVAAPNTAVYMPTFYVPAATAIAVGRSLGLGPFRTLLGARVVNVLMFLVLGWTSLAVARAAQPILFVTLMLPMTLWLAASLNEDGLLIAAGCLGAAALTRIEAGRTGPQWLSGACVLLLGATKPCYLPLGLMMWMCAPRHQPAGRLGAIAAVVLPGLLWAAFAAVYVAVPFARPDYFPGPLWAGDPVLFHSTDPGAQMLVLVHAPWRTALLLWDWVIRDGVQNIISGIGVLGLLDLPLPAALYHAWQLALGSALLASLFGRDSVGVGVARPEIGLIAAAVLASGVAVCLLQYLSWTSVGAASIEGVQGRYWLPLLPFAGLVAAGARLANRPRLRSALVAGPIVVAAVSGAIVARLVVMTYYLR